MAGAMLAAYPELFAGGAVVAGLPYGVATKVPEALGLMRRPREAPGTLVRRAAPEPERWPALAVWHGTADTVVAPGNARAIARQWLDARGLDVEAA